LCNTLLQPPVRNRWNTKQTGFTVALGNGYL
jgi:hypothetical protein